MWLYIIYIIYKRNFNIKSLRNTQKIIIFALLLKNRRDMDYNEKEKDLIQAIRNYRRAYPNGQKELEHYIMDLVYELMEE